MKTTGTLSRNIVLQLLGALMVATIANIFAFELKYKKQL